MIIFHRCIPNCQHTDFSSSFQATTVKAARLNQTTTGLPLLGPVSTVVVKFDEEELPTQTEVRVFDETAMEAELVGFLGLLWGVTVPQVVQVARGRIMWMVHMA